MSSTLWTALVILAPLTRLNTAQLLEEIRNLLLVGVAQTLQDERLDVVHLPVDGLGGTGTSCKKYAQLADGTKDIGVGDRFFLLIRDRCLLVFIIQVLLVAAIVLLTNAV
uniref:Putative secreted protein n=1 Tax=Ixodes ricinus TaxID=34613 RepID=A0A6B0UIX0_IXORI